jgi:phenylacetic acid degradation protein PaaD
MTKPIPADLAQLARRDRFVNAIGIEFIEGGPGRAATRMQIGDGHLNFMGACHGGAIFALADTAFGLASNYLGIMSVGINAHITYSAAAKKGDVLTAHAVELARSKRLATYRIDVTRADGEPVALFTGTVYITGKPIPA